MVSAFLYISLIYDELNFFGHRLEPPAGQLRLASAATSNFTATLISAAAQMFPSKFFSTGGDELNTNCYDKDAQTQSDLKSTGSTLEQALSNFTNASHTELAKLGKTPVVWEGSFA